MLAFVRDRLREATAIDARIREVRFIFAEAPELSRVDIQSTKLGGITAYRVQDKWVLGEAIKGVQFTSGDKALMVRYFRNDLDLDKRRVPALTVEAELIFAHTLEKTCEKTRFSHCIVMAIRPFDDGLSGRRIRHGTVFERSKTGWATRQ